MSNVFSTRQAARKLGITGAALSRYISSGKVPAPQILDIGGKPVHAWTEQQIEAVRELMPKIKNGRKTWRQRKQLAIGNKRLAKAKSKTKKKK